MLESISFRRSGEKTFKKRFEYDSCLYQAKALVVNAAEAGSSGRESLVTGRYDEDHKASSNGVAMQERECVIRNVFALILGLIFQGNGLTLTITT
jgi:hypothetical protein